jgi:hypothetical protein
MKNRKRASGDSWVPLDNFKTQRLNRQSKPINPIGDESMPRGREVERELRRKYRKKDKKRKEKRKAQIKAGQTKAKK